MLLNPYRFGGDPFWTSVTCLAPLEFNTTDTSPVIVDISPYQNHVSYSSSIYIAGGWKGSADHPLFTKNTLRPLNPTSHSYLGNLVFSNPNNSCSLLPGNFTYELHEYFYDDGFWNQYTNPPGIYVGNSILAVAARVFSGNSNNGKLTVVNSGIDSGIAGESAIFSFPFNGADVGKYFHFCLERKGSTIQLRIDGALAASITCSGSFSGVGGYGCFAANLRLTKGVARYDHQAFTPPDAPYYYL